MNKKVLLVLLAMLLAVSFVAGCGSTEPAPEASTEAEATPVAESDADYITEKGTMQIGITLFSPMNYYEGEELIGFETEFAKAVCEKLGVTPEFVEINWDTKEIELNSKNIDCIWNGMTITEERKENMEITNPYMANRQVMIVKAENEAKYAEGVDADTVVVAEKGSTGEELAMENEFFAEANYTAVDAQSTGLMDVAAGTSDVLIGDYV
ncbi:MAG: transporter substrate-binding domain-containing protein, partial [Ruminococcaceae bacterium]|nr:transporter substrate-binding domain-containing protein [Oscillospiraceae bacterium]